MTQLSSDLSVHRTILTLHSGLRIISVSLICFEIIITKLTISLSLWQFLKILSYLVRIASLFFFFFLFLLATLCGLWDLSSPTRY